MRICLGMCMWMQVLVKVSLIFWSLSFRWLQTPWCRCWESNLGHVKSSMTSYLLNSLSSFLPSLWSKVSHWTWSSKVWLCRSARVIETYIFLPTSTPQDWGVAIPSFSFCILFMLDNFVHVQWNMIIYNSYFPPCIPFIYTLNTFSWFMSFFFFFQITHLVQLVLPIYAYIWTLENPVKGHILKRMILCPSET